MSEEHVEYRLDEVDRRILYHLMRDARNVSAPMVAEEVNVSAGTIRNRIHELEDHGIITGYHAAIDFERAEQHLTSVFVCSAPVPDRTNLAQKALEIPGVIDVRELMAGNNNLHITAVGEDIDDTNRIASAVAELGVEIESENLLKTAHHRPYEPFGPDDFQRHTSLTDFVSLAGDAEVIELTVDETATIAGTTLATANETGLLDEDVLVVAIERDGTMITPHGQTEIKPGDLVTVFVREGDRQAITASFTQPQSNNAES